MTVNKFLKWFVGYDFSDLRKRMEEPVLSFDKGLVLDKLDQVLKEYEVVDFATLRNFSKQGSRHYAKAYPFVRFQLRNHEEYDLMNQTFETLKLYEEKNMKHFGQEFGYDEAWFTIDYEEFQEYKRKAEETVELFDRILNIVDAINNDDKGRYDHILMKFEGTFDTILTVFEDSESYYGSVQPSALEQSKELLALFLKVAEKKQEEIDEYEKRLKQATEESHLNLLEMEKKHLNDFVIGVTKDDTDLDDKLGKQ